MKYLMRHGSDPGFSLVELIVVISIICIMAAIGIPQYGRFIAKSKVRRATNDLLQSMRLARTMAIKENRPYLITFNEETANSYRVGFDGDANNSLLDAADGYGNGPVRTVSLPATYGTEVIFGTAATTGPDQPDACPACLGISGNTVAFGATAGPVREVFNTDGTMASTGTVFIMHNARGITYMVRVSYHSGKVDMYMWDGDKNNPTPPVVNNCNGTPVKYCGWTEVR